MSEFCKQCATVVGVDTRFAGLTSPEDWAAGSAKVVLCEGCGPTQVGPQGQCVSSDCDLHRKAPSLGEILNKAERSGYPLVFTLTVKGTSFTAQLVGHDRVVAQATSDDPGRASKQLLTAFTATCKGL